MSDPKTPQQLNEAVAKRLGFASLKDAECAWYDYNGTGITGLDFTDDPAAAVWALDKYCKIRDRGKVDTLHSAANLDLLNDGTWCCFLDFDNSGHGTFCEAISRAIAGTGA